MEAIRESVLKCIFNYADDDNKLVEALNEIVIATGPESYSVIFHVLTHLNIEQREAQKCWQEIVAHRTEMNKALNREVNLRTAICDYFCTINRSFKNPVVVEISIFERKLNAYKYDSLTGLYTRDFFNGMLSRELARTKRYSTELSLIFFDLDDFKKINDTYGHLTGDDALKEVSIIIMDEIRSEDTAARFGGEEMVVLLPETGKIKALIVAERIRERVEQLAIKQKEDIVKMTVSGGISSSPIDGMDASTLIENADKAMYMAKGIGKNNIVLFSTEQRQYLRVDFKAEINVRTIDFNGTLNMTARPKNICTGGILFESPNYMEIGTKVQLQIPVSDQEKPLTMIGTVVRVEALGEERWDIGISFLEVDKASRTEISRYLSKKLVA